MLSNNRLPVLAALALLGGCGGGNRLPPVADASGPPQYGQYGAPAADTRYRAPQQYPSSVPPEFSGPGARYAPPADPAAQYRQPDYAQQAPQYPPPGYPQQQPPAYPPAYPDPSAGAAYPTQSPGAGYPPPPYGDRPEVYTPPQQQRREQPRDYPQPAYAPPSSPQVLGREDRYDAVGYADWAPQAGTVAAAHRSLPIGSFVEVTALDSGRTVLVPITARAASSREIELSGAAAQLLGFGPRGPAPVRVRRVIATGADETALRMGRPAPPRVDTPPVLLNALRNKLRGTVGQAPAPAPEPDLAAPGAAYAPPGATYARPVARAPARAQTPVRAGFYVQVAALSNPGNAAALARQVNGGVKARGGLYLVRVGPYADAATAQRARDGIAQRGYGDARIVRE